MVGLKFTDGIREYEIIEEINIKGKDWWRLKNYTDNKETELIDDDKLQDYISRRKELFIKLNGSKEYEKLRDISIQQRVEREQKELDEYNNDYGFTDGKIDIQKAKILKVLNKKYCYNDKVMTRKDFIYQAIKNHVVRLEEYYDTNRRSLKKINLEYKKLVDKLEYRFWINEESYWTITKTQYDYASYILNNIANNELQEVEE